MCVFISIRSIAVIAVFGILSFSLISQASAQPCTTITATISLNDNFHGAQCTSTKCQCSVQQCRLCTSFRMSTTGVQIPTNCKPPTYRSAQCTAAFVPPPTPIQQGPQLNLSLSRNQIGYDISYSGTGFQPGQTIYMCINGLPGRTAILFTGIFSNVSGDGTIQGYIRETCRGLSSGTATLQASDSSCRPVIAASTFIAPCSY
jgi:hypothetical protein